MHQACLAGVQVTYSYLLLGAPGSGKSHLACQALRREGNGLVALAPGLDEYASYERYLANNPAYKLRGFDDPEFYPSAGAWTATGYDELIAWLRGAYGVLKAAQDANKPLPFTLLVTDTFNAMSVLAQNKTAQRLHMDSPPPSKSPDGAAYWGLQRQMQESIARACRVIKGMGVTWIATCHIAEKEVNKETMMASPEAMGKTAMTPAISGGFRDVLAAAFDVVLYTGVTKLDGQAKHYLQWMPDAKRPTKSRLGSLAEQGKIAADWGQLQDRIKVAEKV